MGTEGDFAVPVIQRHHRRLSSCWNSLSSCGHAQDPSKPFSTLSLP
jgi:hypothetical protein